MISFSDQMKRWAHITGRPLNKFEQMSVARPFKYSKYWRTWSRLIKPVYEGFPLGFIELNLTPLPLDSDSTSCSGIEWEKEIKPMVMRGHLSMTDEEDIFRMGLPAFEYDALVANVGHEQALFMLNCDLWPLMDLEKFVEEQRKNSGGGVQFAQFRLRGTEGMPA
jgi:hypothetical protein